MGKLRNNSGRIIGIVAVLSAACTVAMTISVPYRIHQGIYTWYLWTERLLPFTSLAAFVTAVSALAFGISSRKRLPTVLAVMSCALLLLAIRQGGVHSGPNPQAWCYYNLRKIETATSQLVSEKQLTNGAAITGAQISKYIDGGFETLVCAERGKYIICAVATEARCSVHGSISEMERGWQKKMHQ